MLKKVLCLLMCFSLLSIGVVNAQTKENVSKVVFKAEEITDISKIEERADKGITDDKNFTAASCIIKDNNGSPIDIKSAKTTSQKIKETKSDNGDTITEYSANIIASIPGPEEISAYDSNGYNALLYVNVSYEVGTLGNYNLYKINSLKGKLVKLDSSIVLSRMDIQEMCYGTKYTSVSSSGFAGVDSYNMTAIANSPTNNTYYYNNSLSPYYWNLADGTAGTYIKGITTGYFSRAGSSWSAQVDWKRTAS